MCDMRVPRALRDRLPLLCDGDGILLIPGIGVRDGACVSSHTHPLYVSIFPLDPHDENIRNQQKEETDEE